MCAGSTGRWVNGVSWNGIKAVLVGRPKAWEFGKQNPPDWKQEYRMKQRETTLKTVRQYNSGIPIVQNLDFGHTNPQICLPYGAPIKVLTTDKRIIATF